MTRATYKVYPMYPIAIPALYWLSTRTIGSTGDSTNIGGVDLGPDPLVICDSTTVYFQQQVLPILISNCAIPGCHNLPTDDNDDIQITSYASLMNSGIVQDGDFWDNINDTDPDDRMPPPPQSPLTQEQLAVIGTWLQQGAQNNSCQPLTCDTANVTYSGTIVPLIQQKCQGCHSGSTPQGGLNFTSWGVVNSVAADVDWSCYPALTFGRTYATIRPMLSQCTIDQFLIGSVTGRPTLEHATRLLLSLC